MSLVVDLPPYIVLSFLQDWLSVKENGQLNSAFCNADRLTLIHILEIEISILHADYVSQFVPMIRVLANSMLIGSSWSKDAFTSSSRSNVHDMWKTLMKYKETNQLQQINYLDGTVSVNKLSLLVVSTEETANGGALFFLFHVPTELTIESTAASYASISMNSLQTGTVIWLGIISRGVYSGHCVREEHFTNQWVGNKFSRYEGHVTDSHRHGHGVLRKFNGDRYEGDWFMDKESGTGTMKYANKNEYTGEWRCGAQCGQGSMLYANGDRYTGEWWDDERQGFGLSVEKGGVVFEGLFHENMPVLDNNEVVDVHTTDSREVIDLTSEESTSTVSGSASVGTNMGDYRFDDERGNAVTDWRGQLFPGRSGGQGGEYVFYSRS